MTLDTARVRAQLDELARLRAWPLLLARTGDLDIRFYVAS